MIHRTKIFFGFGSCLIALLVGFMFGAHRKEDRVVQQERLCVANGLATSSDFDYTILLEIDSNRIDVARNMLEKKIFMDLQQIWQNGRKNGDFVNLSTKQRFLDLYPQMHSRVSLTNFEKLPPPVQVELKVFVSEAKSYLKLNSTNQPK